jgi:uncharacterized membrane protein
VFNLTPGYKTTEFYLAIIPYILLVVKQLFGVTLDQSVVTNGVLGAVAAINTVAYIWSRTHLKSTAITAGVVMSQTNNPPTAPIGQKG